MIKKIVLSLFVFLILTFSFVPVAYAQTSSTGTWYNQSFKEWFTKVNDSPENEIFGERYTAAQVQWVIYGLFYFIMNGNQNGNNEIFSCIMKNDIAKCEEPISKLLTSIAPTESAPQPSIASFFLKDRPISFITYTKETARNWHLIPKAEAAPTVRAGFGFNALDPVIDIWRAVRNIAYVFFVIIIVALSFMIMFRVKISPQVVITVQSALPKIAISLILITFSYAIAGLMVDLMYVVIALISVIMAGSGSVTTMFNYLTLGAINLAGVTIPIGLPMLLMAYAFVYSLVLLFVFIAGDGLVGAIINTTILRTVIPFYSIVAIVVFIILLVVFFIAAFKIVWMLIKTLANILLLTIFAPLQIAMGTITSATGFSAWLKSFAGNLAVFPVTGLLFALSWKFLLIAVSFVIGNLFTLPGSAGELIKQLPVASVYNAWPPLLGGGNKIIALIFLGTSLSIMMILPKVVDLIQSFMSGKPFAFGTAIGEAVGPAVGLGKGAALYGAAEGMNIAATKATYLGQPIPGWVQAGRKILGVKG